MLNKNEIIRSFREAKDKPKQIKILAELHACTVDEIREVLADAGFSDEELKLRKKKTQPAPAKKGKISVALSLLQEELKTLAGRELEIPSLIAALQLEFDSIADKRRMIENAASTLKDVLVRGGRVIA